MRRTTTVLLVLALFVLSGQALAQARRGQIELFAGGAIPLAPDEFKDYFKVGYSLHGQYVMFPSERLGVTFGAAYELFSFNGDKFLDELQTTIGPYRDYFDVTGNGHIVELAVGLRPYLTPATAHTQFFLLGQGTYNMLGTEMTVKIDIPGYYSEKETYKDDENKFGIAAGAGFETPLSESMNLIIQGLYRHIFTKDEATTFVGITAGIVF
ncbi:MAG: hypothetical protein QHJ34_11250 [bacterium]|jgi:hypothetical protein|nr:hypothetical protein [candidate division KSB1 bacterium]MDH7560788.1 hypothetical protein [bacterium]